MPHVQKFVKILISLPAADLADLDRIARRRAPRGTEPNRSGTVRELLYEHLEAEKNLKKSPVGS